MDPDHVMPSLTLAAIFNPLALILIVILLLKVYVVYSKGVCRSQQTMDGKTVIITGGNTGIGKETAKELASRNARVILACRNLEKAKRAAQEIFEETQRPVVVKHLDLASFKSVREFASDITQTEERLDVLINNAGMIHDSNTVALTEDGYEICFQSNYLSHCLLTFLLLDLLKKSSPSRIINVSSVLHHLGSMDNFEGKVRGSDSWKYPLLVYSNTKLATVAFTRELAMRLVRHGVTVNSLHPGTVNTDIAENAPGILTVLFNFSGFFGKTPKEGAQTTIFLAVDPILTGVTGQYFVDCKKAGVNRALRDKDRRRKVFQLTTQLVNLGASEQHIVSDLD